MGADWNRIRELFERAVELPAEERERFLMSESGENLSLLEEVRDLLSAHELTGDGFLESPVAAAPAPSTEPPGQIAGFEVGGVLGVGGMGTVYAATQQSPRRDVALKVLTPRRWSWRQARRLELEAEILGRLQHPGIAQVHAAGVQRQSGQDLPWFAMELVAGARTLSEYMAEQQLDVASRLDLFEQICDAVEHAHRKGVVHRDLKPSNILVDERGLVRVIDFGVARLVDPEAESTTRMTLEGEFVGTLAYMSPEQCSGDADAVDTRSDVYALGAVLYELMVGEPPLRVSGGRGLAEAFEAVRNQAPRRSEALTGDLEAIAFKALEKVPERRYPSVAALLFDLRAWREDRPITARPPTVAYHLRLLARRHRAVFVAAVIVLLGLGISALAVARYAVLADERAEQAEAARVVSGEERDAADAALRVLVDTLRAANPLLQNDDVGVVEIAERTAARIDTTPGLPDRARARLHWTLAATYFGVARRDEAIRHSELAMEALGRFDAPARDRAEALIVLGAARGLNGDVPGGIAALEQALEAAESVEDADRAILSSRIAVRSRLAQLQLLAGEPAAAQAHLDAALELGVDAATGTTLAEVCAGMGNLCYQRGDFEGAGRYWSSAIAGFEAELWEDHPMLVQTRSNYAMILQREGRVVEARAVFDATLEAAIERAGETSREAAQVYAKIGFLEMGRGEFGAAEAALQRVIDIQEQIGPKAPAGMGTALQSMGYLRLQQERFVAAREILSRALETRLAGMSASHPDVAAGQLLLGRACLGVQDAEAAHPLLEAAAWTRVRAYGEDSPRTAMARSALGECELALGRPERAAPLIEATLPVIEAAVGADHAEAKAARRRLELLRSARAGGR